MEYRKEEDGYIVVLEIGDEIIASLIEFARAESIEGGAFSGIGALGEMEIGFFDLEAKEYRRKEIFEQRELLSLAGNLAFDGETPMVHAHVILGRPDFHCEGGHLFRGTVSVTCEIEFRPKLRIDREFDGATGLKLWRLR